MANLAERVEALRKRFEQVFGGRPEAIVKGPGRVDLLGSHTDYNEGYVLPVAINLEVLAAGRIADAQRIRVHSTNFDETTEFPLVGISYDKNQKWSNYVRGVAHFLSEAGVKLRGMEVAIDGDVPIGSGLSSSAAIEMAAAVLFQTLIGFDMPRTELALIGQRAENRFVGINTGIMDQFVSCLGKKDHALFLDCRTLDFELVPLKTETVKLVVSDTMRRRGLVDSEYNIRRAQCEEAARILGVKALRDVTPQVFEQRKSELPEVVRRRAQHVIYENDRVLESRQALKLGDMRRFAEIMNASHASARDYYEVSCEELEAMVEAAMSAPGCLSARMVGAGFGGCVVSLVQDAAVNEFLAETGEAYRRRTGISANQYVCTAEDGAGAISG